MIQDLIVHGVDMELNPLEQIVLSRKSEGVE